MKNVKVIIGLFCCLILVVAACYTNRNLSDKKEVQQRRKLEDIQLVYLMSSYSEVLTGMSIAVSSEEISAGEILISRTIDSVEYDKILVLAEKRKIKVLFLDDVGFDLRRDVVMSSIERDSVGWIIKVK